MRFSCCALLGLVFQRETTAGADRNTHLVFQPLRRHWEASYSGCISQCASQTLVLSCQGCGSAAAGCKHGQGWVPPAFTKILLVLPCELGKPVLACVASKYRLLQKLSRYAEHITTFAFHLKIPAWNFPQLTDWAPCCYGLPETRLAPSLLYVLVSLPLFWDNLCMSVFFC